MTMKHEATELGIEVFDKDHHIIYRKKEISQGFLEMTFVVSGDMFVKFTNKGVSLNY